VWYQLNQKLQVERAEFTDIFRAAHAEMRAKGQLDHDLTESEEAEMKAVRVLRPAQP
jgi:hypothetical protein